MKDPFSTEKDTAEEFLEAYDGSLICDCGHGCRGWIEKQRARSSLLIRVMLNKGDTNPDKIAKIPLDRINKIWHFLYRRENKRQNEILWDIEREEKRTGQKMKIEDVIQAIKKPKKENK